MHGKDPKIEMGALLVWPSASVRTIRAWKSAPAVGEDRDGAADLGVAGAEGLLPEHGAV